MVGGTGLLLKMTDNRNRTASECVRACLAVSLAAVLARQAQSALVFDEVGQIVFAEQRWQMQMLMFEAALEVHGVTM